MVDHHSGSGLLASAVSNVHHLKMSVVPMQQRMMRGLVLAHTMAFAVSCSGVVERDPADAPTELQLATHEAHTSIARLVGTNNDRGALVSDGQMAIALGWYATNIGQDAVTHWLSQPDPEMLSLTRGARDQVTVLARGPLGPGVVQVTRDGDPFGIRRIPMDVTVVSRDVGLIAGTESGELLVSDGQLGWLEGSAGFVSVGALFDRKLNPAATSLAFSSDHSFYAVERMRDVFIGKLGAGNAHTVTSPRGAPLSLSPTPLRSGAVLLTTSGLFVLRPEGVQSEIRLAPPVTDVLAGLPLERTHVCVTTDWRVLVVSDKTYFEFK